MNVLFICHGNVIRSQEAEAYFNRDAQGHAATSAGTHVHVREGLRLTPPTLELMAEYGFDLSGKVRRQLRPELVDEADLVVSLTGEEDLPPYLKSSGKLELWPVPDPSGKDYAFRNSVRELVQQKVADLLERLG